MGLNTPGKWNCTRRTLFALTIISALSFSKPITSAAASVHDRGAINESRYIRVGGIDQWVQIRGNDRSAPVLLWLNGGPGLSTIPSTPIFERWEHAFIMVMWDQRGEGKTFERSGKSVADSMTIDQMSTDGIEVAAFLRRHLHKDKIVLLGHSWGSILGIHMITRRPDLFAAYVGTGQVVKLHKQFEAAYPGLLERARDDANAKRELDRIGPPPWNSEDAYKTVNQLAGLLEPVEQAVAAMPSAQNNQPPPAYIVEGAQFSGRLLYDAIGNEDLPAFNTHFSVPVIFIQGKEDYWTTTSTVKSYLDSITAPKKNLIELPNAGHLAIFRDRDKFLEQLVQNVRPLAVDRRAN